MLVDELMEYFFDAVDELSEFVISAMDDSDLRLDGLVGSPRPRRCYYFDDLCGRCEILDLVKKLPFWTAGFV
jgi:hypothetical protein